MTDNHELSPREQEILALVAQGLTNREIAQKLSISPNTVKVHLSNVFEKAGVASRTEATLWGMEHGVVNVPGGGESEESPPTSFLRLFQAYPMILIAIFMLVVIGLITLSTNVIFPPAPSEIAQIEEFDERWEELAPMPVTRTEMALAIYGGDVYAIGGKDLEGVSDGIFTYRPIENRWEQLSGKPTPVAEVNGVVIGEKIYIPGGRLNNGQYTNILEIYDPRTDTWMKGAELPISVGSYALVDFEGRMYLFGGWNGGQVLSDVLIYDPNENTWTKGTSMDSPRRDAAAITFSDKIIILGGRNSESILDSTQVYYPSRDLEGDEPWQQYPDLPTARYDLGVVNISNNLLVIGGKSSAENLSKENFIIYFTGENWHNRNTKVDEISQELILVQDGPDIYIFTYDANNESHDFWRYTPGYYEIFVPFIQ